MTTEQKLEQAVALARLFEAADRPMSAEVIRGLIRLVRELEAEVKALREVKA